MSAGELRVSAEKAEVFTAAAHDLLERLATSQARDQVPAISLTGGSVADTVHREVARLSRAGAGHAPDVDWSRVDVFWGDERFVGPDDPDRNEKQAREALLDHVGVDPARVHAMPSTEDAPDVYAAAEQYAARLGEHAPSGFDVLMLGLGPDRHIASLFPGHAAVGVRDAPTVGLTDAPKPPPHRISLTLPTLARTRAVWFFVVGAGKADAVAETRRADVGADVAPGAALLEAPEVRWYLDEPAAGSL